MDLEYSYLALLGQVSLMLSFHFGFFLVFGQFVCLVSVEVVLDSLLDYELDFLLTLGGVSYGFLSHYPEVVRHGDSWLRWRHQSKRNLFLLLSLLLNSFLSSQLFLLLVSQEERDSDLLLSFYLLISHGDWMLYKMSYSIQVYVLILYLAIRP